LSLICFYYLFLIILMRGLLLLVLISTIACTNYQDLYNCMQDKCIHLINGPDCKNETTCWNDLTIRDTCLLQNNCNFTTNPED
jgi:hypothetical protein